MKKRDGDKEMEKEGKNAYELGYDDGKAQQPRPDLLFEEPHDNKLYNKGWYAGFKETVENTT